jgi:hypothetical protein
MDRSALLAGRDATAAKHLLVGRDATATKRLLALALAVFAAVFVLVTPSEVLGFEPPLRANIVALFVLTATLPIFGAVVNDGALVSIALAGGPALGFYLPLTAFDMVYPSESVLWGLGTASMFAIPLGLIGFALGSGRRRLIERAR